MSQENVEIVRRAYEAFDRRDFETIVGLGSEDFELDISAHPIPDFPNVGTGAEHQRQFLATYLEGFSDYAVEITRIIEAGDRVLVACHDTARLGPGIVERDFTHVWTIAPAGGAEGAPAFDQWCPTEAALGPTRPRVAQSPGGGLG